MRKLKIKDEDSSNFDFLERLEIYKEKKENICLKLIKFKLTVTYHAKFMIHQLFNIRH